VTSIAIFQLPSKDNRERLSDFEAMKMNKNPICLYLGTYMRYLIPLRILSLPDYCISTVPYEDTFTKHLVRCLHLALCICDKFTWILSFPVGHITAAWSQGKLATSLQKWLLCMACQSTSFTIDNREGDYITSFEDFGSILVNGLVWVFFTTKAADINLW